MNRHSGDAWERAMKVEEVILRAMAKRITWRQAAEIIGIPDRSMRRWRERCEKYGYDGLLDRQGGKPRKRSADLFGRSAVFFCCQLGTNRRPPKQVCGTQCVRGGGPRRTAEPKRADH